MHPTSNLAAHCLRTKDLCISSDRLVGEEDRSGLPCLGLNKGQRDDDESLLQSLSPPNWKARKKECKNHEFPRRLNSIYLGLEFLEPEISLFLGCVTGCVIEGIEGSDDLLERIGCSGGHDVKRIVFERRKGMQMESK